MSNDSGLKYGGDKQKEQGGGSSDKLKESV